MGVRKKLQIWLVMKKVKKIRYNAYCLIDNRGLDRCMREFLPFYVEPQILSNKHCCSASCCQVVKVTDFGF